jgi:hypothetical protein
MPRSSKQEVDRFELAEEMYGDLDRQDFRRQYEGRWDFNESPDADGHERRPRCDNCGKPKSSADIGCTKCDPRARRAGMPGPVLTPSNQSD